MKFKDCVIGWNVKYDPDPDSYLKLESDEVDVAYLETATEKWRRFYTSSGGGCYTFVQELTPLESKCMVYIDAMHLIIRDKINPMAVHNAFLKIDEYREGLSSDMPDSKRGNL